MSQQPLRATDTPPTPTEQVEATDRAEAAERADTIVQDPTSAHTGSAPGRVDDPDAELAHPQGQVHAPATDRLAAASLEQSPPNGIRSATDDGEVEVECPGCGLLLVGHAPRPSAEWFCPRCDYPVFWASPPRDEETSRSRRARRRLPGSQGREVLGAVSCWHCGEHVEPDATVCLRCAATLPRPTPPDPVPEVVTIEVERPLPVPYPARTAVWPFVLGALLGGLALGLSATLWLVEASGGLIGLRLLGGG